MSEITPLLSPLPLVAPAPVPGAPHAAHSVAPVLRSVKADGGLKLPQSALPQLLPLLLSCTAAPTGKSWAQRKPIVPARSYLLRRTRSNTSANQQYFTAAHIPFQKRCMDY
jgi:hypothetical protein